MMDGARDGIRSTLAELRTFLAQESVPRLSEADTKAYFIEPIIAALGWIGIGVVTREYYVKNSQEFIDYVLFSASDPGAGQVPVLAIETKALQVDLTEKHAAQLIQYCAVEGIEWAALTNGRELQFFNTFLKPDLAAKRVMRLDLLAFNSDEEFDILCEQLWQLSQESIITASVRTWLNQLRLDKAVRETILNPASPIIKHLRKVLAGSEVRASPQELVQWFRAQLAPPIPRIHSRAQRQAAELSPNISPKGGNLSDVVGRIEQRPSSRVETTELLVALKVAVGERISTAKWRALSSYSAAEDEGRTFLYVNSRERGQALKIDLALPADYSHPRVTDDGRGRTFSKFVMIHAVAEIDDDLMALIEASRNHQRSGRTAAYYGVTLKQLVDSGILPTGTRLIFVGRGVALARAEVDSAGEIVWQGKAYRTLSDRAFSALLGPGRVSVNGWTQWYAELPAGQVQLSELRSAYLAQDRASADRVKRMS